MTDMLTRTLGETIEIGTRATKDAWRASADPGQVENALLNLAINARDAMPNGGKLTIECINVKLDQHYVDENPEALPGDFAVIAVSNTGTGISTDVLAHVFEPFFTTKEVGQGSGLGLSMVYGFTKQSGGHVSTYSEEGRGTTVKLYLPRSRQASENKATQITTSIPLGTGETVLVIEDDEAVRILATETLIGLGYQVIAAAEALAARDILAQGTHVDLII
jgi:signal transduction histidine kinase